MERERAKQAGRAVASQREARHELYLEQAQLTLPLPLTITPTLALSLALNLTPPLCLE